jgi:hypothetical protein
MKRWCVFLLSFGFIATAAAADNYSGTPAKSLSPRYTFSWSFTDADALKPRGGTTQGAPVTLDTTPSKEWLALQEKDLSKFERDRRAILAMAGTYRVAFDFLEITPFNGENKPKAPYQSWGTEKIYVDDDRNGRVSLVHIIEMRIVQKDGTISEPIINKHWHQDWQYEPKDIAEYVGRDRWVKRALTKEESRGQWSQTVYQVDDSPRYASIGAWQHNPSFSTWISGDTWRPLPRREWTTRKDYQVLEGTNRHTISATGWVQEENNLKTVLTDDRKMDPARPFLAREYGVARYERIRDFDFAAADDYYNKTRAFWTQVLDTWNRKFAAQSQITLKGPADELGSFVPLFEYADGLTTGTSRGSVATLIDKTIAGMEAAR